MSEKNGDLICAMMATRGQLLQSLGGLREETAGTRPEPQEWSVLEILHHVADADAVNLRRIGEILGGKEKLSAVDPAEWEDHRKAAAADGFSGIVRRMYAGRAGLLDAVAGLSQSELEMTGTHPRRGPMTARQLVEMVIHHDEDHAQQVSKTRAVVER